MQQYQSKTGQLKTTPMVYLDCQEREVSKLLVETSNLVIRNPGLVLSSRLRTTFIKKKIWGWKNIYNLFQIEFLLSGRGPPQTTGLPGSCRPCRCLRCRPAPAGPERAASDTHPSLLGTEWCIARQRHHYKQKDLIMIRINMDLPKLHRQDGKITKISQLLSTQFQDRYMNRYKTAV